jgi:hypothetical protein
MSSPRFLVGIAVLLAAGALGCAGETSAGGNYNSGTPGPSSGAPGQTPPPAPATPPLPGSSGTGGAGGSPGQGGSAGTGGGGGGAVVDGGSRSADAGSAPPGSPMPPPPTPPPVGQPPSSEPCAVVVAPLSPQRFTDVPAGEGYRLRVGARAEGSNVPAKPTWRWQITHESSLTVPHALVDGDPAVVEFPTEMTGRYTIQAEILGLPAGCRDSKTAYAVVPNRLFARFRVRATPPADAGLALFETDILVSAGTPVTKTIDLQPGYPVTIDPQDERGVALPAYYVRVAARTSTARFDGYVLPGERRMGFQTLLDLGQRYDVLLVPDRVAGAVARAPLAYLSLTAEQLRLQSYRVDPGIRLRGTVRGPGGPVAGARIRLRSGALPSTVGESAADGTFELRARGGRFEVRVLPPEASGLPEAQLPQSIGLTLPDPAPAEMPLDFTYDAIPAVQLNLTVQGAGGGASAPNVKVLLESEPDVLALASVGSFRSGGVELPASGTVRRVRTTNAAGLATFEALPRARYRATLVPPEDAPGDAAVTTVTDLDLVAAATTRTAVLGRRTRLSGRLTPSTLAAGLLVKAVDAAEDGVGRTVTTTVGAEGRYELPVDPGRVFRLFIEPPSGRRVPRIPLEPVRGKTTNITLDRTVPAPLPLTGMAQHNGAPLSGVVIQVFCVGSAPTCIDAEAPDISNTPPIDETVSTGGGRYQLFVPDPGQ